MVSHYCNSFQKTPRTQQSSNLHLPKGSFSKTSKNSPSVPSLRARSLFYHSAGNIQYSPDSGMARLARQVSVSTHWKSRQYVLYCDVRHKTRLLGRQPIGRVNQRRRNGFQKSMCWVVSAALRHRTGAACTSQSSGKLGEIESNEQQCYYSFGPAR